LKHPASTFRFRFITLGGEGHQISASVLTETIAIAEWFAQLSFEVNSQHKSNVI